MIHLCIKVLKDSISKCPNEFMSSKHVVSLFSHDKHNRKYWNTNFSIFNIMLLIYIINLICQKYFACIRLFYILFINSMIIYTGTVGHAMWYWQWLYIRTCFLMQHALEPFEVIFTFSLSIDLWSYQFEHC